MKQTRENDFEKPKVAENDKTNKPPRSKQPRVSQNTILDRE